MLFSTSIPDKLQEHPNVSAFMNVLDELQNFKTEIIANSLRVNNFAVLMDRKWLIKKLEEYGVTDLPLNYPIQILRQYLLNVDAVCRTRGSKIGIELYCSVLSLGEVIIDDSKFYADSNILLLDSMTNGYITEDSNADKFYLTGDSSSFDPPTTLKITIKSKYFNGNYPTEALLIQNFLKSSIKYNLGFSKVNVMFTFASRNDFYFHKLLNKYFV